MLIEIQNEIFKIKDTEILENYSYKNKYGVRVYNNRKGNKNSNFEDYKKDS
jgi:hypothetical protein